MGNVRVGWPPNNERDKLADVLQLKPGYSLTRAGQSRFDPLVCNVTLQLAIHNAGLYRDNEHVQRPKLGAKGLAEVTDIGFGRGVDGDTDLRLTEIATRVGYRSEFSFSRACKSARGVS